MKKFYLFSVLLFAVWSLQAQYVYNNFDDKQNVYFSGWENTPTIVTNPNASGINTSTNVAKWVRGTKQWANVSTGALPSPIDLSTDTVFYLKVYSPIACDVKLKLQVGDDYTKSVEKDQSIASDDVNKWVQLKFTFNKISNSTYNNIVIFFDPGSTTDNTFYFDDVIGPFDKPLAASNVQDNFENDGTATIDDWKFQDPNLDPLQTVTGPVNSSNHVANYNRSGNFQWTNAQAILDNRLDLRIRNVFKLRVYFPSSNDYSGSLTKTVSIKLQNSSLQGDGWKTEKAITKTITQLDQWQTLEFDFSSVADSIHYDKIIVQLGGQGHNVAGQFYFDDFMLEKAFASIQDGNWNDAASWKGGEIPDNQCNVVIDNQITVTNDVSSPAECNKLTINSGAKLLIDAGKALTVNSITNNAGNSGLLVESNNNGTGSLIISSGNPAATVRCYLTGYTNPDSDKGWHEIGCPVNSMTISNSDFVPSSDPYDLYKFDESNSATPWLNYKGGDFNDSQFQAGKGYLVAYKTTGAKSFTGNLNTGNYTENLNYTSGAAYAGWNLLGNPYTSAIDWNSITKSANVNTTVYVLDASTGNYRSWNSVSHDGDLQNGIIPVNQGFFVYTTATGESITMKPSDQIHKGNNIFKSSSATNPNNLIITLSNGSTKNNTFIQFRKDATALFDNALDGLKLFGLGSVSEIYTYDNDTAYTINCLPDNLTNYALPIGVKIKKEGQYFLHFSGFNTFNLPENVILEDRQTGATVNLAEKTVYHFTATKKNYFNRFVLHINGVTAVPQHKNNGEIHVYAYGQTVVIKGNKNLNGKVSVFNLMGQKVFTGQLNGTNKQSIKITQTPGIYLIKVNDTYGVTTKKVFIQ